MIATVTDRAGYACLYASRRPLEPWNKKRDAHGSVPPVWRPRSESNRRTRICNPLHNHSATRPVTVGKLNAFGGACALPCAFPFRKKQNPTMGVLSKGFPLLETGAGNETRTRDPDLGKVVLYQLSYSR